jgi:hypothetical protein
MNEHMRDADAMVNQWKQAFDMVPDESGAWEWRESFVEGDEWYEKYDALLKEWNRFQAPRLTWIQATSTRGVGWIFQTRYGRVCDP